MSNNNTGTDNSGDYNSGYYNSGDYNSGYRNSGDYNSGNRNSGDYNSGNYNSGDYNSGNRNSGNYNSGNYNSGWFNTDEPKIRFFNKDSDMTYSDFSDKYSLVYPYLKTCSWVYAKDMTDQEKKDNPDFETTDGYLKTMTYKEAWAEYWNRASDEDKEFFTTLPNFDSAIFLEITGIDVEK